MIGLGTLINTASIVAAGIAGHFSGKLFGAEKQQALTTACGICVVFIGISGAMTGMLRVTENGLEAVKSMFVVLCIAAGTVAGELLDIERHFGRFGEWLRNKSGNAKDTRFVDAFVTASLTVCIGAMAVVGALEDGIRGDYSMLAVKSVLDFIIIAVMTPALGKGCAFSAIPILVFEGLITLFARLIAPVLSAPAVQNISFVGSILIFCVGLNLLREKKIRVANMLPSVVFAVAAAYLPL